MTSARSSRGALADVGLGRRGGRQPHQPHQPGADHRRRKHRPAVELLPEPLRDFVRRRATPSATEEVEIVSAWLGERAELMAQSRSSSTAPAPPSPAPVSSQPMMEEVSMPVSTRRRGAVALVLAAMLALVVAACGSDDNGSTGTGASTSTSGGGKPVALLLPESKTARYESQDRPNFERKLKSLCPDCDIIYSNADQDPAKQQQQAEAAITKGAKVLVLDPVDAASAASIVTRASSRTWGSSATTASSPARTSTTTSRSTT
jgi:Periplasmic binding protein domain